MSATETYTIPTAYVSPASLEFGPDELFRLGAPCELIYPTHRPLPHNAMPLKVAIGARRGENWLHPAARHVRTEPHGEFNQRIIR